MFANDHDEDPFNLPLSWLHVYVCMYTDHTGHSQRHEVQLYIGMIKPSMFWDHYLDPHLLIRLQGQMEENEKEMDSSSRPEHEWTKVGEWCAKKCDVIKHPVHLSRLCP